MSNMTKKQGQYLAFIHLYTKLHRQAPAQAEIQERFGATPPTVHQMILTLERNGFISRIPGEARSLKVLVDEAEIPDLE